MSIFLPSSKPQNSPSRKSKVWEIIPPDCHEVTVDFGQTISDLLSGKISWFLEGNERQCELIKKAGFLSIEEFYSESNPEKILGLINQIGLPFRLSSQEEITKENAKQWVLTSLNGMKELWKYKPTPEELGRIESVLLDQKVLAEFFIRARCMMIDLLSLAAYGRFMHNVIEAAKKGNEEAILMALRLDRALLYSNWAKEYMLQATYAGRADKIADVIQKISNPMKSINTKRFRFVEQFILIILWPLGLNKHTRQEILDFFEELGLYRQLNEGAVASEDSLSHLIANLKKKGYLVSLRD